MATEKSCKRISKWLIVGTIVISFLIGLLIPSPLFYFCDGRVFMAKDTTDMIMSDGSVYEGTVNAFSGKLDGYGVLKKMGVSYIGKWIDGEFVAGKMTNGQMTYEGRFQGDLNINGFGMANYHSAYIDSMRATGLPDSEIVTTYIGNWNNNVRSGLGRAVMADSTMVFGHFKNGVFVKPQGANFRVGEQVYGIDVSHFQRNIDWDNLALYCDSQGKVFYNTPASKTYMQPVFFVYVKATEGRAYKDKTFATRMTAAKKHRIARGAYHFLKLNNGTAEEQIENFTEMVKWLPGDLPPVLDVELDTEILAVGVKNFQDFAYTWLKGVEKKLGVKPMIYTTDKIRNLYMKNDPRFDEFHYWIARYSRNKPTSTDWKFWQFAYQGVLNGSDTPVDIDIYHSDFASFSQYLKGLGTKTNN